MNVKKAKWACEWIYSHNKLTCIPQSCGEPREHQTACRKVRFLSENCRNDKQKQHKYFKDTRNSPIFEYRVLQFIKKEQM